MPAQEQGLKLKLKFASGDQMYKPDKKQVHQLKKNEHEFLKKLPKVEEVQNLIKAKKIIHNNVILGIDTNKVKISPALQNLHYSEAGRSPRLSDLGAPKEPKPYVENIPSKFM
jgi:Tfp pilus assembly protein PilO